MSPENTEGRSTLRFYKIVPPAIQLGKTAEVPRITPPFRSLIDDVQGFRIKPAKELNDDFPIHALELRPSIFSRIASIIRK